jgi:Ni,Fe-hydrogenase III small subunit/ferredoxin
MDEKRKDIMGNGIETVKDPISDLRDFTGYRGRISLVPNMLPDPASYREAEEICASKAIKIQADGQGSKITLDMGKCFLCGRCEEAAPSLFKVEGAFVIPAKKREELVESLGKLKNESFEQMGNELKQKIGKVLGRSLAVREVDAGSCNGGEIEVIALNNPIYDVERFGIHFVASPRHADVLLVTGPASRNMELALKRTYEATPDPKVVVAVGACGCSGGIFGDTYATTGGIDKIVPVDVYIPGCPPRPEALLYGLLLAVDRIPQKRG